MAFDSTTVSDVGRRKPVTETREAPQSSIPVEHPTSAIPIVLFLCVQNAGRSQMAAGWLSHLAGDQVKVMSGGSAPGEEVHPNVVTAMREVGIDVSRQFPQRWTDEVVRAADVVVTMGCGDACPFYPGKRYEDWDVTDPADASLEEVRTIRAEIRRRVEALMASVGIGPDDLG